MFSKLRIALQAFIRVWKTPALIDQLNDKKTKPQVESKQKDLSHLTLLRSLQKHGRLVDFFQENIDSYTDEQVGAAARQVHKDCAKLLEEWVGFRPVFETEKEGQEMELGDDYDPLAIRLLGEVGSKGPYKGILRHKGWRALKLSLPQKMEKESLILAQAELEIE